jgi:undecaprenyl pyrophosphate phosphatase UppP
MNKQQIDKLMNVLLGISAFLIMLGALLKLQHIQYGNLILWIGFITSFILSNFEISRLKKIIKSSNRQI